MLERKKKKIFVDEEKQYGRKGRKEGQWEEK